MTDSNSPRQVTRRRFLLGTWGAALVAFFGENMAAFLKLAQPVRGEGTFGTVIRAGNVEEFPVGSVSYVRIGRFYLIRMEEGFLALWQTCTHLGCSVPWIEDQQLFHCPCHSSIFNQKGEVIAGPAPRPLDIFPITIVSGDVMVDTGNPIRRSKFDVSQLTRV